MKKGYKVIRVITVAPVLALIMAGLVAGSCESIFPSPWHLVYSMFFLGVLPLLAYPLQKYIPAYKDKGREGQRQSVRYWQFLCLWQVWRRSAIHFFS